MFSSQNTHTTRSSRDLHRQEQRTAQHNTQLNDQAQATTTITPPSQDQQLISPQQPPDVHIPDQFRPQAQQQQRSSPFNNAMQANGARNPFGKPPVYAGGLNKDPYERPPTEPNTPLPPNPYDKSGPPGLSTNFVDINCACVKNIRSSKCDLPFQSFASCHNAVLTATMKRNMPPMFFQCEGQYARMMMCIQSAGLKGDLIDDPSVDKVFVRGL